MIFEQFYPLEAACFERVINVPGGFDAWVPAGLPVVKAGAA